MSESLERLQAALGERYQLEREIGRGGMATVYLAEDRTHHRSVALKVLRPELIGLHGPERFLREIEVTAQLSHPNILPLLDSGIADGVPYYVMPFVEGESLRARLARERQLPVEEVISIADDIAQGLSYAHSHGVLHRDIKPENVLMAGQRAVLADFGVAQGLQTAGDDRLTETGFTVGTPGYMSPEQASGDKLLDGRSDQYSLGCIVYEMLGGEAPHSGPSPQAILARQLTEDPRPIATIRSAVTRAVDNVLRRALSRSAVDRYPSVTEFSNALASAARSSRGLQMIRAVRRPFSWRGAGGVGVVAAVVAAFLLWPAQAVPFEQRDWLLITDVENRTGDPVFDGSLEPALHNAIAQSQHVNVFPEARVRETLRRMDRPDVEALDHAVGMEVALRENVRVVLTSAVSLVGETYVLTAQLLAPATGETYETMTVRTEGQRTVLDGLDRLARQVRRALGESRRAINRNGVYLPQATTPSLEALKAFAEGSRAWTLGELEQARLLYEEALRYDSAFAWVHTALGNYWSWNNDRSRSEWHFERALAELDRLTARERMWILAVIAGARRDSEEAIDRLNAYLREYPDDRDAWFNLGSAYMRLQRCEDATPALRRALTLDPTLGSAHIQAATCLGMRGDPEGAIGHYAQAFALDSGAVTRGNLNHEFGASHVRLGNYDTADSIFRLMLTGTAQQRAAGQRSLGLLASLRGRYADAIDAFRQAITFNQSDGALLSEVRNRLYLAVALQRVEREVEAITEIDRAADMVIELETDPYWYLLAGRIYARMGRVERARPLVQRARGIMRENPLDRSAVELLEGEIALANGQVDSAVAWLEVAHGRRSDAFFGEALARGYHRANRREDAIRVYEQVVAEGPWGWEGQEPWIDSHLRLAQLYEEAERFEDAVAMYRRFLGFWDQPDPALVSDREAATERLEALRQAHGIG